MKKCTCAHAGQCPINDKVDPLHATYPDGTKVNRPLTDREASQGRLRAAGRDLRKPPVGGVVASDGEGNMYLVAMAIDPDRAIAYARSPMGRCRAHSFMWRLRHPVPEADHAITAEQVEAWEAAGGSRRTAP